MTNSPMKDGAAGGFNRDERELELLAAYALGALEPGEEPEVERLLLNADDRRAARALELAAAAATVGVLGRDLEPMPASVREALARSGTDWVRAGGALPAGAEQSGRDDEDARGTLRVTAWTGWIAAAACLTLAGVMWMPIARRSNAPEISGATTREASTIRQKLLVYQGNVLLTAWVPLDPPDPTAVSATGDIVWCTETQTGVVRLSGLAANNPEDFQYQLWIFDEAQKHPIDGGVFDIPADAEGDVMIRVNPKIPVCKPTKFAITVEKPGGVVVSDRERVALLGADLKSARCSKKGAK